MAPPPRLGACGTAMCQPRSASRRTSVKACMTRLDGRASPIRSRAPAPPRGSCCPGWRTARTAPSTTAQRMCTNPPASEHGACSACSLPGRRHDFCQPVVLWPSTVDRGVIVGLHPYTVKQCTHDASCGGRSRAWRALLKDRVGPQGVQSRPAVAFRHDHPAEVVNVPQALPPPLRRSFAPPWSSATACAMACRRPIGRRGNTASAVVSWTTVGFFNPSIK
jgi:hypothetical protein